MGNRVQDISYWKFEVERAIQDITGEELWGMMQKGKNVKKQLVKRQIVKRLPFYKYESKSLPFLVNESEEVLI